MEFSDRTFVVLGLGRSGLASAKVLKQGGAEVWAWDDDAKARERAMGVGISIVEPGGCDWDAVAALVLSPGIPYRHPKPHPVVEMAYAADCEIIGDFELLAQAGGKISTIGITGTNGKSTTTALIGSILDNSKIKAEVGGNIGVPVLELPRFDEAGVYVLEVSSFQLELIRSLSFNVAVLLNISPDHLDRHGSMEEYAAAKESIFDRQTAAHTAVIGVDDDICRSIFEKLKDSGQQKIIPVSGNGRIDGGVYVADNILVDETGTGPVPIMNMNMAPGLPGGHNHQNAAAAFAAARAAGATRDAIVEGLKFFSGLEHRQELVAVIDGVSYVNDSKATNVEAAAMAIGCYDNVYWIAGGRLKEDGLQRLRPGFDRIRHAYLIGESADVFARALDGNVEFTRSSVIEKAVPAARSRALREGCEKPVVLLSPVGSSFDQFSNFADRGEAFRRSVKALS